VVDFTGMRTGEGRFTLPASDLSPTVADHPLLAQLLRGEFEAPEDFDLCTLAQRLDIAHAEDRSCPFGWCKCYVT
jgi:hypothetical protein